MTIRLYLKTFTKEGYIHIITTMRFLHLICSHKNHKRKKEKNINEMDNINYIHGIKIFSEKFV